MPDRLPSDEIEVLKGQVSALTHCLGFALVILNAQSGGAVLEWFDRRDIITDDDRRWEGAADVLERLRHFIERSTPHDGDDT